MNRKLFSIASLLLALILLLGTFGPGVLATAAATSFAGAATSFAGAATSFAGAASAQGAGPDAGGGSHLAMPAGDVTGTQRVMVLRIYFHDYSSTTRYSKAEVEGFFGQLDTLWQNISYGKIDIDYQVSDLFQLPGDRSDYVTDGHTPGTCAEDSNGDLSCGSQFLDVLTDAIANSPSGLDWTNLQAVMVVMAETDPAEFHRGLGTGDCDLPMGPGGSVAHVGCAIFSENPSETDLQVWGRWAHEIGHAFQQAGPAHPSNYKSEFELMDSNYPGQSGVFEKQSDQGFPGWLPPTKYQTFTPTCSVGPTPCTGLGGGTALLWAMEYDPAGMPNAQAAKAYVTDNLYYLISVRRRVNGDELNGGNQGGPAGTNGIPDEGVLIERVEEGADQEVTVMGQGGDRNALWHQGDTYADTDDGIQIGVALNVDDDNYEVRVLYDQDASMQPDVMLYPWTSPPGNTWETTDIWIDSPVNGFNTFRYGTWNSLAGDVVPVGNGDNPAAGMVNRLYARVRNVGGAPASNVVVHFEISDPPGLGISSDTGWASLGTVTSADFPTLANINPGDYVDVYIEWKPDVAIPAAEVADGMFAWHTCLRVKLDAVSGETVLGNQDGDMEQENVFYLDVPSAPGDLAYDAVIHLHNDDLVNSRFFVLDYESDLPADWTLDVNGGNLGLELAPGAQVDVPIKITAGTVVSPLVSVGDAFGVDVRASYQRLLVNDLDPNDQHPTFEAVGGVRVQASVLQQTDLQCIVRRAADGRIYVKCHLGGVDPYYEPNDPPRLMVAALPRLPIGPVPNITEFVYLPVDSTGDAEGYFPANDQTKGARVVVALYAGSRYLTTAGSGYRIIDPNSLYLPLILRNVAP